MQFSLGLRRYHSMKLKCCRSAKCLRNTIPPSVSSDRDLETRAPLRQLLGVWRLGQRNTPTSLHYCFQVSVQLSEESHGLRRRICIRIGIRHEDRCGIVEQASKMWLAFTSSAEYHMETPVVSGGMPSLSELGELTGNTLHALKCLTSHMHDHMNLAIGRTT